MLIPPQNLTGNLTKVRDRIRQATAAAGRNEDSVTLLAISKGHPAAVIQAVSQLGQQDFGENFVQEALGKIEALAALELTWHFTGQLQANKTRAVAENFAWVHTVDRVKILERLAAQRPFHAPPLQVCLQVRIADEAGKGGVAPEDCLPLVEAALGSPRIKLRGLMCIPPPEIRVERQRFWFDQVAQLFGELRRTASEMDTLSMGMSDDLEAAIASGSTLVRIGTAIFGPRAPATGSKIAG
jgi:hypothetical protein